MNVETKEIILEPADNNRLLCGLFDDNIKQLERRLGIESNGRDNIFKLVGKPLCVDAATSILTSLYVDTAPLRGIIADIEPEQIHLAIKLTGDVTQIDLARNQKSGLRHAVEVLAEVEKISFNFFHSEDVVCHPVVSCIVNAYEAWESANQKRKDQLAAERKRESLGQSNGAAQGGSGSQSVGEHNA